MVGYTLGKFVLRQRIKNLNIVIPILMYFLTINIENALFFMKCKRQQQHITRTLTLGFRQYIAE